MKGRRFGTPGSLFFPVLFLISFGAGQLHAQTVPAAAAYYDQGRKAMMTEDWYTAAEAFIECLRLNPAHAEGTAALAESYYELGEFDEALTWVRKARSLARGNMDVANLEASTLIALGRLDAAAAVISEILSREPYNREALFASAELDVARGRSAEAVLRFRQAVSRYPDDRRLLLSLALVLGSLGDGESARPFIERALAQHSEDYRVYYYASYLDAQAGRISEAIHYAGEALQRRPGYAPAQSLLASLWYRSGQYEQAVNLADELISRNREDAGSWYLKGLAYVRMGRRADAIRVLTEAASIDGEDEFIRASLEDLLITATVLEDPQRSRWATWHFARGRDYRSRNLADQALFEYRRGLRLNPYAKERREYAEILRLQGYPARYLEELRFLQDQGVADRSLNDAVEVYDSLLSDALFRRWQVNPIELSKPHWKIAVFSIVSQSSFYHADAGAVGAAWIRELLIHDRNIAPMEIELRQPSFSQAFRSAREAGADYFLVITVSENERDLSVKGELFVGRTGSPAGTFYTYRTGQDRLRNASRGLLEQLSAALPFRAELLVRRQAQALMDKGRVDGVKPELVYDVVKKGRTTILNEGIGLYYAPDDVVGTFTVENADEEVSAGALVRSGFFDRIAVGDELILPNQKTESAALKENQTNPELQNLLRRLR
jgi:tetratricopeptide (TPR) repeat protein